MGFRGRRATVAVGLGAAVLAAGAVDSPAAAAATRTTVYKGTATMTVGVYDYCGWGGEPRYLGTATYKLAAKLTVSPTQKSGRQSEGNPFHFSFAAGTPRTNGSLFLASSETFRVSSPPLLLRYWKYT